MLRSLAALLGNTREAFHLTVTLTESGLDVAASGAGALGDKARRIAVEAAIRENLQDCPSMATSSSNR